MKKQTLRDYIAVHSWVGIVCGLFLFIAFYAGAFSMLDPAITRWTQASHPQAAVSPDADAALDRFLAEHPDAKGRLSLRLANDQQTAPLLKLSDSQRHESSFELGQDGALRHLNRAQEADDTGNFVDYLHRKGGLPLPLDWAEPAIGIVSLLYALALVSGVVALLPSLVKDLFHLRLGANFKRMWLDVHNLLGVASLPFHIVIAVSAAVFGLHDWIYAAQDHFIYRDGLRATVARESAPPPAIARADWLKPSELVVKIREQAPHFEPQILDYVGLGGKRTLLFVAGSNETHFKRGAQFGYAFVNLATGEIYDRTYLPGEQRSALGAALSSFFSLHFGSFGNDSVRVLYILLGLSGALIFYTGNILWVESRTKRLRKRPETSELSEQTEQAAQRAWHVDILSKVTLGVCLGCAAALPATIAVARWLAPWVDDLNGVHQVTFHAVFGACVLVAIRLGNARAAVPLLWLTALCNALVPLTAWAAHFVPAELLLPLRKPYQDGFLMLELLCLFLAVFFGWLAWRFQRVPHSSASPSPISSSLPSDAKPS